ncbi:MAG: hypothetical protein AABW56_05545 [Nanoarchaeota archaeon]
MSPFLVFFITFFLELIVYLIFLKKPRLIIIAYCFLINLFTWPIANLIYNYINLFWLIEFGVFLIEAILIKLLFTVDWKKAFMVSLIANATTAAISFLV